MTSVDQIRPANPAWDGASAAPGGGLQELLLVLRRRKALIACSVLIVFVTAAVVFLGLTPRYTATTVVMINPHEEKIVDFDAVMSGVSPDEESIQSELEVITSPDLAWQVVQEFGLEANPEFNPALRPSALAALEAKAKPPFKRATRWLRTRLSGRPAIDAADLVSAGDTKRAAVIGRFLSRLDVQVVGRSRAIEISFSSENPVLAAAVANKIAHDYLLQQLRAETDATNEASAWIARRLDELGAAVDTAERKAEFFHSHSAIAEGRSSDDIDDQMRGLNQEYVSAQADLDQKTSELAQLDEVLRQKGVVEAGKLLHSNLIGALEVQDEQLIQAGAALSQSFGMGYPDMQANSAQKRSIERQIAAEGGKVIANLRNDVQVLRGRVTADNLALVNLRTLGAKIGEAEVTLRALKSDADAKREVQQDFLARAQQLKQSGLQPINASIVSAAAAPVQPSFPKLLILLPIALVVSCAAAALLTAAAEALDQGLRDSDDVRAQCGTELVALVPKFRKPRPARSLRELLQNDFLFTEAIGSLQVALTTTVRQRENSVLFTSAMPREGKSTIVVALAQRMALSGKKILAIDCDFRRPRLGQYFGLPNDCGLGDVVTGRTSFEAAVQRDGESGAHVLTAGLPIRPGQEHSAIARLGDLLTDLRREFDYVLIDSPPVLAVSDVRMLAAVAQQSIVIARWGKTSRSAVDETLRLLRTAGATVSGMALSFVHKAATKRYGLCHAGYYPGARAYYNDIEKRRA